MTERRANLGHIEVESVKLGDMLLDTEPGTRGSRRLRMKGLNGHGAELTLQPADDWNGVGIMAEVMLFAAPKSANGDREGYARCTLQLVRDSAGGDVAVLDVSGSGTRPMMPLDIRTGGRTNDKTGEYLGGEKTVASMYGDGSMEYSLPNGDRVDVASAIETALGKRDFPIIRDAHGNYLTQAEYAQRVFNLSRVEMPPDASS